MNDLMPIEYENKRVLTTELLAELYETSQGAIRMNLSRNKDRYKEGIHYYLVPPSDPCLQQIVTNENRNRNLYLWTEKGALYHAKSLGTDKAWSIYETLVDTYFRAKEMVNRFNAMIPSTYAEALELAARQARELEEQKPKVAFADDFQSAKGNILIRQMAKMLDDTGEKRLYAWLRQDKILMANNEPYQKYREQGLFKVKAGTHVDKNGKTVTHYTWTVTPKGQYWIWKRWNEMRGQLVLKISNQ